MEASTVVAKHSRPEAQHSSQENRYSAAGNVNEPGLVLFVRGKQRTEQNRSPGLRSGKGGARRLSCPCVLLAAGGIFATTELMKLAHRCGRPIPPIPHPLGRPQ